MDLKQSINDGKKAIRELKEIEVRIRDVVKDEISSEMSDALDELENYLLADAIDAKAEIESLESEIEDLESSRA